MVGSRIGVPHRMWTYEEKVKIVKSRLEDKLTFKEITMKYNINGSLASVWCRQYRTYGPLYLKSKLERKRSEKPIE